MFTRNNIMRHNMCGRAMRDWLCFTAESANATIRLDKVGSPDPVSLETSPDGKTWVQYTWSDNTGATITLTSVGDKCYWRATSTNSTFSNSSSIYYKYAMTGQVAASGNIMSLLDKNCVSSLTQWVFFNLFNGCSSLTTLPDLPAQALAENCYRNMFVDCSNLAQVQDLPARALAENCYAHMFVRCSSIKNAKINARQLSSMCCSRMFEDCASIELIEIQFSSWDDAYLSTNNWVRSSSGTFSASGTFICPAALDTSVRDGNHVPTGWVVKKRAYISGGTIYNDAAHTTATTLIAGELYIAQDAGNALYYYNGSTLGTAHDAYYYGGTMYSDKEHTSAITPTAGEYYFDQEGHAVYLYSGGEYTKVYPTS